MEGIDFKEKEMRHEELVVLVANKVQEIVEWINEQERLKTLTIPEAINLAKEDIKRQARGTKESRGEEINRLLKEKHECQWEPGGSMTQNENANI